MLKSIYIYRVTKPNYFNRRTKGTVRQEDEILIFMWTAEREICSSVVGVTSCIIQCEDITLCRSLFVLPEVTDLLLCRSHPEPIYHSKECMDWLMLIRMSLWCLSAPTLAGYPVSSVAFVCGNPLWMHASSCRQCSSEAWLIRSSLNLLRTATGRCKALMQK